MATNANATVVALFNHFERGMQQQHFLANVLRCCAASVGDYKYSAKTSDNLGWVVCDGRSLAKAAYPNLHAVIGSSFGGDATTFKLPDFRGRVPGALGGGASLTPRSLGDVVGAETHTLTLDQIPGHSHGGATSTEGSHAHGTNANGGALGLAVSDGANTSITTDSSPGEVNLSATPPALVVNSSGEHSHSISSNGGGLAHPNMQPTLFGGSVFIFAGIL